MRTLKRHVSNTIKRTRRSEEVTKECSGEFDFVKFDPINESFIADLNYENPVKDDGYEAIAKDSKTRKGILWQQSGNIFSSWQERFFVLTESSLYSYSRQGPSRKNLADIKKFVTKIKLSEIIEVNLVEKKGQLVIEIVTRSGKTYLRKPEGVREWFEHILENREDTKKERILQRSFSLMDNSCYQDTVTSYKIHQEDKVTSLKSQEWDTVTSLNSYGTDTVTSLKSHGGDTVTSLNSHGGDTGTSLKSHGGDIVKSLNSHGGNTVISLKSHGGDTVKSLNSHGGNTVISLKSHGGDTVKSLNSHGGDTVISLNSHGGDTMASLKSTPARPFMGCRSLSFARKEQQICRNPNI